MSKHNRTTLAYGVKESKGKYILEDYQWSRNHNRAISIRRWKRDLKSKARAFNRRMIQKILVDI